MEIRIKVQIWIFITKTHQYLKKAIDSENRSLRFKYVLDVYAYLKYTYIFKAELSVRLPNVYIFTSSRYTFSSSVTQSEECFVNLTRGINKWITNVKYIRSKISICSVCTYLRKWEIFNNILCFPFVPMIFYILFVTVRPFLDFLFLIIRMCSKVYITCHLFYINHLEVYVYNRSVQINASLG